MDVNASILKERSQNPENEPSQMAHAAFPLTNISFCLLGIFLNYIVFDVSYHTSHGLSGKVQ